MALNQLVEQLNHIALFNGLSEDQLKRIIMSSEKIIFHPEQSIIRKDEFGDKGFLILSGHAQRISGPGLGHRPEILGPGTFIGEMALLVKAEYGSTIISCDEVRALKFSHAVFENLMKHDPLIAEHFADHMRERFLCFTSQLKDLELSMNEKSHSDVDKGEDNLEAKSSGVFSLRNLMPSSAPVSQSQNLQ